MKEETSHRMMKIEMSQCGAAGTAGMTLMRIGKLVKCVVVAADHVLGLSVAF
jgi:hypothetical protein